MSTTGTVLKAYRRPVLGASLLALTLWLLSSGGVAHADRFGLPWQGEVTSDRTVVYSRPDPASPTAGPLARGAIVAILDRVEDADGDYWAVIPDGFVPSDDLAERRDPWLAEVSVRSVSVYAKPNAKSDVRRTAREGDLLRVTGISPGLDGDTNVWWATTEGYVPLRTVRWAAGDWAHWWDLPNPAEAPKGWWGTIRFQANVRAAPTTASPIVGSFAGGERVKVLAEEQGENVRGNALWYRIDGGRYAGARVHSSLVQRMPDPRPNTTAPSSDAAPGPWIVVDRSSSTLTFVRDGRPEFVTYVALGKAGVDTPTGTYSTFGKFRADDMTSASVANPTRSYDLPNVPFTQYYLEGGFAIHGTYWHVVYGSRESQGCINLTWGDSAYLFGLTRPTVPDGTNEAWEAGGGGPATPVVILD